jgi:hypothetical protein
MTNQPRRPLRSDVAARPQWEPPPDDGDPPINPSRRDTDAANATTAVTATAVGAQDRCWRELLNSTPIGGLQAS